MYFTKEKIQKNAKLVRLKIDDNTAEQMIPELENVINWIKGLDNVNTDGVDPLITTANHNLPKRDDVTDTNIYKDKVLSNAPSKSRDGNFFTVPKIIE